MTKNPSAGKTLQRKLGVAVFNGNGNTVAVQIPRANLYRSIILELDVTINVAGASNTVANTGRGDEWACGTRIRVVANGTDAIFDMEANDLWWLNAYLFGTPPRVISTLGDGATASPALKSVLEIPFWLLRARKPMDAALESWNYNSLEVQITYGAPTLINSAANATYTSPPQITIYGNELTPPFVEGTNTLKFRSPFYSRTVRQVLDYSAAQSQGKFTLDASPFSRAVLLNIQPQGGGADTVATLTNIKMYDGSRLVRDWTGEALQRRGQVQFGVPGGVEFATTGIASQTKMRISASNDPRAWYALNICEDGLMSEAIGGMQTGDKFFELQLSGACRVVAIDLQVLSNPFINVG